MNIRTKNTLVLTCVFVALLIVSLGVRHFVLAPSFQSLEYEEALKNGNRCVQAVEREIDHLNSVCLEWSDWDDLHQYVVDRNEGFHQANLATTEYFQRANLPVMVILDVNNRVVWMTRLDLETLEQVELPEFPRDEFPADHPLIRTNHPKGYINGILLTERGPMLVASRPITTTDAQGERRGRFIMSRYINESMLTQLRAQTDVDFNVWSNHDPLPADAPADFAAASPEQLIHPDPENPSKLSVYRTLDCLTPGDSIVFRAGVDRAITRHGQNATSAALLTLVVGGGFVLLVLMLALQRIVIHPLARLTHHAHKVGTTGDLTARISLDRSDEIGVLARAFDLMTERLAQAQASLADASRHAGAAEVTAGVLHNVGNVLNSVVISMHGVKQSVSGSRAAGLTKVAELMREHKHDLARFIESDPRGKQLPEYLDKLSEAVGVDQSALTRDVTRLSESINQIVEIIGSQQCNAGATEVIEAADAVEVVRSATTVVRASCERHGVRLELDLPSPIRTLVDRSRLQQVVVNLLTNALDAVKPVAPENRVIHVGVRGDEQSFWVEVRDQGVGFDPATNARLFQQGFTTREGGHGVGLHFCAISARQMGGEITGESRGPGEGATFRVRVPIRRDEARIAA
jgi:signal transduction histidine kinase